MNKRKMYKIILIFMIFSAVIVTNNYKAKGNNTVKYTKVIVYPGDTLWSIATEHNDNKVDIRKLIHKIRTANNLKSAIILPGQELVIPLQ